MTSPSITAPHDHFFKALMERPGAAGALIRERLPPAVVALLSDDPPELMPGTFIDQALGEHQSDRLYRMWTKAGTPLFAYALIEHKSTHDDRVSLQLLRYLTRAWEALDREAEHKGKLPPIIPLVVYHGAQSWTAPRCFSGLIDADEALRPLLLDFPFTVADLGRIPDPALSSLAVLRFGLRLLKHVFLGTDPRLLIDDEALAELRADPEFFWQVMHYILTTLEMPDRAVATELVRRIRPGEEDAMVSRFAEELLTKGRAEGEAKGKAEGKAEGEAKGKAETLLRQLGRRFRVVPDARRTQILAASQEQLDAWLDAVLDAKTLDDVFAVTTH